MFDHIVGNSQVKKRLEILLEQNCLPHLLLFCGLQGVGKRLFAESLARSWIQKSSSDFAADLHQFLPEGKTGMHSIHSIRRLLEVVALAPFNGPRKAIIVDDAERMLPTSANALLKTLEEPPENTLIILVTSLPERLLGTIVSRCQTVRFCPLAEDEVASILCKKHAATEDAAKIIAKSAHGSLHKALELYLQKGEPLEAILFSHLAKKRGFFEVAALAKEFQKRLDAKRKAQESELRSQYTALLKDAPAAQRQLIEQEIEGVLSLSIMHEVQELFYIIQAFFIDLERIEADLPLHFESCRELLLQAKKEGRKIPFERLLKEIQQAKVAIERSSPIQNTLESLLLVLN